MRKIIDLHQDIILTYSDDPMQFFAPSVQHINDVYNAGGYIDYQQSSIDLVVAATWPYHMEGNPVDYQNRKITFDAQKLPEYIQKYKQLETKIPFVYTKSDIDLQGMKILLHVEGYDTIKSTHDIDMFYELGVRSFGLTWNFDTTLAASAGGDGGGLTALGREMIEYMQHKGILVDTAHMYHQAMMEVLHLAKKPVMNSHSNIYALYTHQRNVFDDFLQLLAKNGGVLGLSIYTPFMSQGKVTLDDYIKQIQYVRNLIGDDHIALGTDFHGIAVSKTVEGVSSIRGLNLLYDHIEKQCGSAFAEKFFYSNAKRILKECLPE